MAIRIVAALKPVAAILLAFTLGAATGQAQTADNLILPVLPTKATAAKPPHTPRAAPIAARQMVSPFDRVIAPQIAELLKGKKLVSPGAVRPMSNASSAAAEGVNFPGFVSAPYLTLNDGSSAQIANTVTGDFNHDGKPDVAIVREDGTIDVILSPGSGIASQTPIVSNTGDPLSLEIVDVVVADMNGDGIPDLVGQDYANGQIVVWIGNGDGTFSAPHTYLPKFSDATKTALMSSILVGDFNHDGTMDVATLSFLNNASTTTIIEQTFLNNGSGALDPLPELDTVFNDFYYQNVGNAAVTSSDGVNATGIIFMVDHTALSDNNDIGGNDLIAMASNGNGTFQPPIAPATDLIQKDFQISVYGSVIATNLTAKGAGQPTTDIVFMTGDGAVWDAPFTSGNPTTSHILVGANYWAYVFDPTVTATPPTSVNNTVELWPTSLSVDDMNGDGLQDLVVYLYNGIAVYPNAGSGVFSATPTQMESDRGVVQQAQPADYDGSGYNSLVNVDYYLGQVGYMQNLGAAGSPTTGQFVGTSVPTGINATNGNAELLGSDFWVLATADINGDGILDVIGLDTSNNETNIPPLVVGLSNGSAPGNQTSNYTFTTVDNPDFANSLYDNGYVEPVTISNAHGTNILIANDYYAINAGGPYLYLLPIAKTGAVGAPQNLNFGAAGLATLQNCQLSLADVGDVNGDGVSDIVIACGGNESTVSGFFTFLGNADGSFQTATFTPLGVSIYMVKLINFTGAPGKLDLAAFDSNLTNLITPALDLYVVPNKGDGSGSFDLTKFTKPVTNYDITDIVVGDYNADGKQDLTLLTLGHWDPLIGNTDVNTSGALLLPGNGDYTFGTPTLVATNTYPISGAYADFNGDGLPDLALNVLVSGVTPFTYEYAPLAQVLPNLGGGSFGTPIVEFHPIIPNVDYVTQTTFVGPFTKSGGPDLIIGSDYGAALYINRGVTTMGLTASSATPGQGVPVTFTATISQVMSAGAAPTGTVSFTANGILLGSAAPDQGVATFTADSLSVGADTVTATFAGDANHNQSSATIGITVVAVAPSFVLSSTTPTLSLTQGSSGSVVVTVAADSTFNGVVQLTCTGAPAEASCTPSPVSVTLMPGQSSTASILIATTPPNNTSQASNKPPLAGTLAGINLAGFVFMVWLGRRRLPGYLSTLVFAVLALTAFGAMSGCNGSGNKYPGTVAGKYTLTVTGVSGGITQTQSVALTVTLPTQ